MKYDIPYLVEEFNKNGYIILRHCMSDDLLSNISDANASVIKSHKTAMIDTYLRESNLMELDPRYWDLLTLEPVLTLVKALLCDQPRLMSSELLIRQPKDDDPVKWHEDGPAYPTYRSLGKPCPLMQIKIGFFLTDCEKENMGNLAIVPGSHLEESPPPMTFEKLDGMEQVLISKGDVILFHNALWHRVMDNLYDIRRENIYLAFCLPWMAPMDRSSSSDFLRSALPPDKRKLLLDFEKPGENYELRKKVFRSGLKSGLLAQIKNFVIMIKRRLRKLKHNFLGENVW